MISKVLLTALTVTISVWAPQLSAKQQTHDFIDSYSASIYHELVEIRRDLYNHPEPSGEEQRTSTIVAQYLLDLGLEVKTNVGGYGVVGVLKGAKPGKHIAWRADMDAARFSFGFDKQTNFYEHKAGHVCGHDVHTTIGLGIANVLSQNVTELAGTVYFLFQPAEESQEGAKAMIKDGLFELIEPDEIYGLHVGPMQTGTISTMPGNVFSHARRIRLDFDGIGDFEALTDTVNTVMRSLVRVESPSKFLKLQNITDPSLGLGNQNTIYRDYVIFYADPHARKLENGLAFHTEVYTTRREELDQVVQQIRDKLEQTKYKDRLRSVEYFDEREGVDNNPQLVKETISTLRSIFGADVVNKSYGQIPFSSEDFGHFQRKVPGVYFFLGAANENLGITAFPHMSNFSVDETSIKVGVNYFSTLILERLNYR